jgi:hypothetical protein
MKKSMKKSDGLKKLLAALLSASLLVTLATFASSEGNETLNTSLNQEDVTYEPYDPLDSIGDAGEVGTFLIGDENQDGATAIGEGTPEDGAAGIGEENPEDGATVIGEENPEDGATVIGEGNPEDGATAIGEGSPEDGATAIGEGSPDGSWDGDGTGNYPAALLPPENGGSALYPAASLGAIDYDDPASGAAISPAPDAPFLPVGPLTPGGIFVAPEIDPEGGFGIGRPPTPGGIYVVPELVPEIGGPDPEGTEEEPTQGAIEEEDVATPEAIEIATYAAINTIIVDLSLYGANGALGRQDTPDAAYLALGYKYTFDDTGTRPDSAQGNKKGGSEWYRLTFDSKADGKEYIFTGSAKGLAVVFDGCQDVRVTLDNVELTPDVYSAAYKYWRGSFRLINNASVSLYLVGSNKIRGCDNLGPANDSNAGAITPGQATSNSDTSAKTVQSEAGIGVCAGTTLTIYGPGVLEATGGRGSAGIGGRAGDNSSSEKHKQRNNCGTVIIYSGTVIAKAPALNPVPNYPSFFRGAGIGGSMYGLGGNVEIYGGRIELEGWQPIGAGYCHGDNCGNGKADGKGNIILSGDVTGDGYAVRYLPYEPTRPRDDARGDGQNDKKLYRLTVKVMNPSPVEGARVAINLGGYDYHGVTGANGIAYCWVPNEIIAKEKITASIGQYSATAVADVAVGDLSDHSALMTNNPVTLGPKYPDRREVTVTLDPAAGKNKVTGTIIYRDHYAKGTSRPTTLGSDVAIVWDGKFITTMPDMSGYYKWGHYLSDGLGQAGKAEDAIGRGRANMILSENVNYSNLPDGFVLIYEYLDMSKSDMIDMDWPKEMKFWADSASAIKGANANGENEYEVQSPAYTFVNRSYHPVKVSVVSVAAIKPDGLLFTPQARNEYEIDINLGMSVEGALRGSGQVERFDGVAMSNPVLLGKVEGVRTTQRPGDTKGTVKIGGTYVGKTLPARARRPELKFCFRFEPQP